MTVLSNYQISKIKQLIKLAPNKSVVRLDVSDDKLLLSKDTNANIYCIDQDNNIIWQINDLHDEPPFEEDMFVYLGKADDGRILAYRFSGFEYKIDVKTGNAKRIGWHK